MWGIPGTKNISYRKPSTYEVVKRINGKLEYFGRYHTLEEAIKWRDYFQQNKWNLDLRLVGTVNKNIYFKLGKYRIYKRINGKEYGFGSFNTYEDAEKRVKEIRLIGWEKVLYNNERLLETTVTNIIHLPNGKFEIVKTINGVRETFGCFDNYDDAVDEVKLLRKCNWDYDIICESIDESDNGIIFVDNDKKMSSPFEKKLKRMDYIEF